MEIPTVGPVGAGLLITRIINPQGFRSGRLCTARVGLTAKDHSTGGRQRPGGITRAGDESLRAVLVSGATACIQQVRRGRIVPSPWLAALLERKPPKLVAVALANRTVRIAWKLMTRASATIQTIGGTAGGPALRNVAGSAPRPPLQLRRPATAMLWPPENFRVTVFVTAR
jgi:transposase